MFEKKSCLNFFYEGPLPSQFTGMKDHGTKIVLYNLWEDDQGQLELDFDTDPCVSSPTFYF